MQGRFHSAKTANKKQPAKLEITQSCICTPTAWASWPCICICRPMSEFHTASQRQPLMYDFDNIEIMKICGISGLKWLEATLSLTAPVCSNVS
jgi:hypothetical protein